MTFVTPTAAPSPAGWYRDPLGLPQLRWWNGMTWTNTIQENRPELHAAGIPSVLGSFAA